MGRADIRSNGGEDAPAPCNDCLFYVDCATDGLACKLFHCYINGELHKLTPVQMQELRVPTKRMAQTIFCQVDQH